MNETFKYLRSVVLFMSVVAIVLAFQGISNIYAQDSASVDEIERMKAKYNAEYSIADLAPTVCAAAGLRAPKDGTANKIEKVLNGLDKDLDGRKVQKVFIHCADCMGEVLFRDHPDEFTNALAISNETIRCTNVMTMVTPVCYATIFTGANPEVHGIVEYIRPVVKIETLFDVFLEAGKKIAIVTRPGYSIGLIFRERNIDYIDSPRSDKESLEKALEVLRDGDYDVIVWHDGEYDATMHAYGTESEQAANARRSVISNWDTVVKAVDEAWSNYDRLVVFAPDHGSHTPEGSTHGTHGYDSLKDAGDDCYEDAVLLHLYRWGAAQK